MPETTASIVLKLKDEATKSISRLNKEVVSFRSVLKGLTVAAGAVAGVGTAIALMAQKGEEIIALRSSFQSLSAGIGENADEMLSAMQTATSGLVSNAELIEKANNAILLGLPVTTESMAEMSEAAVVLGRAMGIDATSALDSMILGLGRQSKMILDNLGITVDAAKANEVYAKELGKTVNELTDAERKQAFFNITMEAATEKVKELGAVTLGFGGQVAVARASIVNFKDDLFAFTSAMADALMPALTQALGLTDDFGRSLEFDAKIATEFVKGALTFLIDAFALITLASKNVIQGFNLLQFAIGKLDAALLDFFALIVKGVEISLGSLGKLAEALGAETVAANLQAASDATEGFRKSVEDLAATSDQWGEDAVNDMMELESSTKNVLAATENLRAGIQTIPTKVITEGMEGAAKAVQTAAKSAKDDLKPALADAAKSAGKIGEAIKKAFENIGGRAKDNIISALTSPDIKTAGEEFSKTLGVSLVDQLAAGLTTLEKELPELKIGDQVAESLKGGILQSLLSGDVSGAVRGLGDMLEGVAVLGFDVGAILNAITSINKELPKLLFSSIKDLLINLVAELPLLIGNIIPDLIVPILELLPEIVKGFGRNLPVMIDLIIRSLPDLIKALVVALFFIQPQVIIAQIIFSALDSAFEMWLGEGYVKFKEQLIVDLAAAALETIEFFRSGIPDLFADIGAAFEQSITQPFLDVWTETFSIATEIFDQTYGRLPELAQQAGELVAGPLGDVVDSFQKVVESIPGAGGNGGGVVGQVRGALGFQAGTPFVPRTMLAQVHQGEAIIPAAQNPFAGGGAVGGLGGGNSFNFIFNLAPGTPQDQAQQFFNLIETNPRGVIDKLRRAIERQG